MNLTGKLRPGMRIIGPDNHDYGAIKRHDDASFYVEGRRIPFQAIERLDGDRLYLNSAGAYGLIEQGNTGTSTDGTVRVPTVEGRLEVGKRQVDLGEIHVHKTVEEVDDMRQEPLTYAEVHVERVKVNRKVDAPEVQRQEGEWLIIPVMEEVLVVQKQLVVAEEIRIRKQRVTQQHEIHETVRREHASIEDTRVQASPIPQSASSTPSDDPAWKALHEDARESAR